MTLFDLRRALLWRSLRTGLTAPGYKNATGYKNAFGY